MSPTPQDDRPRRLATLLSTLSGPVRRGALEDHEITGIATRSEDVEPGSLFVALPGTSADGHSFLANAAKRGAAAALVERDVGGTLDFPLIRVEDSRCALAELAAAWHGWPAEGLVLVGITGTAGKTSTLALLETILAVAGEPVGTIGSLGLRVRGETLEETSYTTPDPADALNEVEEEEYAAFLEPLEHGVPHEERAGVAEAVRPVLERAGEGDLVLLLGAQGMDRGRDVARDWLEGRAPDGALHPVAQPDLEV